MIKLILTILLYAFIIIGLAMISVKMIAFIFLALLGMMLMYKKV